MTKFEVYLGKINVAVEIGKVRDEGMKIKVGDHCSSCSNKTLNWSMVCRN